MNLMAQCLLSLSQNLVVVESQMRHLVECEPPRIGSVIAALHLLHPHQGIVGNGDDALTRVAVGGREGVKLPDISAFQACLFLQLTHRTLLGTLVHIQETARESPSSLVGFDATLHQQHIQLCTVETENDTVGGDTRVRILITILFIFVGNAHILFFIYYNHKLFNTKSSQRHQKLPNPRHIIRRHPPR